MKKMLAIALAATMTLTMSLSSIADNIKQLGNFVLTEDALIDDSKEEVPEEDTIEDPINDADYTDTYNPTNTVKNNPSTGAGNLDLMVLSAIGIVVCGALTIRKK